MTATRDDCAARDADDPLAPLRDRFALDRADAEGLIYLDGNSLGALPRATPGRIRQVVEDEWGADLVRSWNTAGWVDLPQRVGDKIARLVGAAPGGLIAADSTSVNLHKVLSAALAIAQADAPGRRRLVTERSNFPGDLYIAEGVARAHGCELAVVDDETVAAEIDDRLAVLVLSHVNYRTGRLYPMAGLNRAAHQAGALVVWDLAHSAAAVPVSLEAGGAEESADFAVGCGYKYLNGGPGAPGFAWVHPRHTARLDRDGWRPPVPGWFGHEKPFEFTPEYRPGHGMSRFLYGTPPLLSLAALECGVDSVLAADGLGGMAAIRQKSIALTELFIEILEARCAGHGLTLVSPRDAGARGSQVTLSAAEGAFPIVQALIARGVIGDFRAPDGLRFGFTPLYTRFVDVWDAVDRFEGVLASGEWRQPAFSRRAAVT